MSSFLTKLSSYNLFNYLLPGILFVIIVSKFTEYYLILDDVVLGFFLYYFIGMIISRIGSIIIEPILKKLNVIKFKEYFEFVKASDQDGKLEILSEVNNTYRTLLSMFAVIVVLKLFELVSVQFGLSEQSSLMIFTILSIILFLFSYRKQTNYIFKRIEARKP